MAEFLTTEGISNHLRQIIDEAQKAIVLLSPYVQMPYEIFEKLEKASRKKVNIIFVHGKTKLKPNDQHLLSKIQNIKAYYLQNLHSKCYFNESQMIITSLNIIQYSEHNNHEMGILVNRKSDKVIYEKALHETDLIVQKATLLNLSSNSINTKTSTSTRSTQIKIPEFRKSIVDFTRGHCIRCQRNIPHNPDHPYCSKCYSSWNQFGNEEYEEQYCHSCGDYEYSSMIKPQCYECYKHDR